MAVAIDAGQVKALRDRTGLGFMQCKEALQEAGGNVEKAVDLLRQKGLKSADKKADRATSQGRIGAVVDPKTGRGALVELCCESDFVARNDDFAAMVDRLARHLAAAAQAPSAEALPGQPLFDDPKTTVEALIKASVAKIGENIQLKRVLRYDPPAGGRCGFYVHPPGRIAVLMELAGVPAGKDAEAQALIKDLCMHVAATNPLAVAPEEIPQDVLAREEAVYRVQVREKPPQVADKIVKGKLEAFFSERCLVRQPFVKDPSVTVQARIQAAIPGASIRRFARLEIGG